MAKTLASCKPGEQGIILQIDGSTHLARRLAEMGMTAGAKVQVVRYAPLGDPMEIRVRGYSLALRKKDAKKIALRE